MTLIISQPNIFDQKCSILSSWGVDKLQVITDFDRTLTRMEVNGVKKIWSFAMLQHSGYLPLEYQNKALELFHTYFKIEMDHSLPLEYRKQKMTEWTAKHMTLLIKYGLTDTHIQQTAKENLEVLRKWIDDFFQYVSEKWAPIIISSAWVWNLIEQFLLSMGIDMGNIHIHSNFLHFDEQGLPWGFSDIVNILDKDLSVVDFGSFQMKLRGRIHCIVLGDAPQDVHMIANMWFNETLKIGFLNHDVDTLLSHYTALFDAVIVGDWDFSHVNRMIREII